MRDPVYVSEAEADVRREHLQEKVEFRAQDIYASLVDSDLAIIEALNSCEWDKATFVDLIRRFREGDEAAIGRTVYLLIKDALYDQATQQAEREWWNL